MTTHSSILRRMVRYYSLRSLLNWLHLNMTHMRSAEDIPKEFGRFIFGTPGGSMSATHHYITFEAETALLIRAVIIRKKQDETWPYPK